MERTRSILYGAHLPMQLWAEIFDTVRYLYTLGPVKYIKDGIPTTIFHNLKSRKVSVDHLRIIGCIAYMHIPDEVRHKLEMKSMKTILIGYAQEQKGYRVWNPENNKIYTTRDVVFDETKFGIEKGELGGVEALTDNDEYDVEKITKERFFKGRHEYYVKWVGYGESVNTWESYETMKDTEALEKWEQEQKTHIAIGDLERLPDDFDMDPVNMEDALSRPDRDKWIEAMHDEIESLKNNETWELVKRPEDREVIDTKWVFHIKHNIDGTVERRKGRFVVRGFTQIPGVDYNETYSPVISYTGLRMLMALAIQYGLRIHQMDVKSAYLHGEIDTEIFIEQPHLFEERSHADWVYKLKKGLYGLKQAGRIWHQTLQKYLLEIGYISLDSEPSIYWKKIKNRMIIVAVYVDDLQLLCNDEELLNEAKEELKGRFKMSDLGEVHHILGLRVLRKDGKISIDQAHYVEKMLKKYQIEECIPVSTPVDNSLKLIPITDEKDIVDAKEYRSIVGALNYVAVLTRPDIAFAVGIVSRYMQKPGKLHWMAVKRIMRYLKGTSNYGLIYHKKDLEKNIILEALCDSDWAGNIVDRKSTTGYMTMLGETILSWKSGKQECVASSTLEAEYIAASTAAKEIIWLRKLMEELGYKQDEPTVMKMDNSGARNLANNEMLSQRMKHIDIRYHFI
jgi:Reverse transcriptase (RNA-dependent DNA polymerase)/Chromo (CHRromatin Organisation MOdifier) domain